MRRALKSGRGRLVDLNIWLDRTEQNIDEKNREEFDCRKIKKHSYTEKA